MGERHCKTCVCGCTCGFGGEHVEDSPRCALTTKERPTMTTYTPTPEAVEAAARASYESFMARITRHFAEHGATLRPARPWEEVSDVDRETFREDAERALTAAGPIIAEKAWDECSRTVRLRDFEAVCDPNPYAQKETTP